MILSLDKASDEQLLHAMAGGDMEALGELYCRHESQVYRYLVTCLNDSATAADLLNDVMLDVWRGAARFAGRSKVTTWMLGIAHQKVLNHWRRQSGRVFTDAEHECLAQAQKDDPKRAQDADSMAALPPGESGLARLKRDIAHNRAPQPVRRRANLWKPLALVASVLVAIEAGLLIGNDPREVHDTSLAPASAEATITGPRLQIVFGDSTSLSEMQVMLQAVNARLVDGPGALGIWTLELPDGANVQAVREQLQASPGVEQTIAL